MTHKIWRAIGVMSGTSLDGLDLVYVKFISDEVYNFEILQADTLKYSEYWKKILQEAFNKPSKNLAVLSLKYGQFLGNEINTFKAKHNINNLDFIASHGHTVFHKPNLGYTLQIGSGNTIAKITGDKVVCDFRAQDVALGGQGAPLVPIGDAYLFFEYNYCLNLGGFSNVSFNHQGIRKAYDICPVNIVLNQLVKPLDFDYDASGALAASGQLHKELLDKLNTLSFYKDTQPKSLGYEFVDETINPILSQFKIPTRDLLRTYTEHIAQQIALKLKPNGTVLVTGGGTYNTYLLKRLSALSDCNFVIPNNTLVDFKEALIFAFLGLRRLNNQVNCLKSVTGASKDHSSGNIFG
jgi:anhydro-N-acetylmuramic acid kinase